MFTLLASIISIPLGVALRGKSSARRRRAQVTIGRNPRAVAGHACCSACARDQDLGLMERGTTCAPCGGTTESPLAYNGALIDRIATRIGLSLSLDDAVYYVLQAAHPVDIDGTMIVWTDLCESDPARLHLLATRVHARVRALHAHWCDVECGRQWVSSGFPVSSGLGHAGPPPPSPTPPGGSCPPGTTWNGQNCTGSGPTGPVGNWYGKEKIRPPSPNSPGGGGQ